MVVCTVDRESFTLKIICVKIFRVVKFSRSHLIHKIFLTVDDCNMDKRLESSWCLVNYQVSGEPGITRCSCQLDIYLGECGLVRKLIRWSSPRNFIFHVFNFRGWSRREIILAAKFSQSMVRTYHCTKPSPLRWLDTKMWSKVQTEQLAVAGWDWLAAILWAMLS